MITPIILAAGASTRMGRPKADLPVGDTTALGLILRACAGLPALGAPLVVAGERAPVTPARVVTNPRWALGRATSIQAGLAALPREAEAFLLWPVDVCLPGVEVLRRLIDGWRGARARGGLAWVPTFERRRGHPLLLAREAAPRLEALAPDAPARDVVRALDAEGALVHVEVDDATVVMEMNTPEQYERWRAWRRA